MKSMYVRFGVALGLSFATMLVLSMSMIRERDHFYVNASNAWMALIMVAAMAVIMLGTMWPMFANLTVKVVLVAVSLSVFAGAWYLGRQEVGVGNEQFLKSMIPHHSRAILVCQESHLTDPEIVELCKGIVQSQSAEIAQMQQILKRY